MRWPQTFILLAILLFLIQFIGATWIVPEVEGAGKVRGGPYWNKSIYMDQQHAKGQQSRYNDVKYMQEVQQVHMNTLHMRRYRTETARRNQLPTPVYKYHKIKPSSASSWNYRRANE